jgi:lipopolysaccharide transport system permease protein
MVPVKGSPGEILVAPRTQETFRQTLSIAWQLARLDLVRRYTSTGLGMLWAILSPLGMSLVIGAVFAKVFNQGLAEFLPYLFVNLTLWAFFVACLEGGAIAFIAAEGYIKQVPNVSLAAYPLRMAFGAFAALCFGLFAATMVTIVLGGTVNASWLSILPALGLWLIFGIALANLSAVLNTMVRDFTYVQTVGVQALFYATPIMYPPEILVEHGLAWLLTFNPVYHLLMLVRTPIVFGDLPPMSHYFASAIILLVLVPLAIFAVRRSRSSVVFWL